MAPKDKAIELLNKYWDNVGVDDFELKSSQEMAKQCALIHIDHLLIIISDLGDSVWAANFKSFYEEVRTELENL